MAVFHVLKGGKRVDDITGMVVRKDDCEGVYALLSELNRDAVEKKEDEE